MATQKSALGIFLRGIAMGAADVVPGVSGGTIAFITGIYETLLTSIKSVDLDAIKLLFTGKFAEFWIKINGSFLCFLLLGIVSSILSLALFIQYLLANHPIVIWSFFFGLIIASALMIARMITKWKFVTVVIFGGGIVVAYFITTLTPISANENLPYLFFCGAIALCAMILPGISGSFILILLGAYATILNAVTDLKTDFLSSLTTLGVFIAGGITGLLLFSRLLSWTFQHARNSTLAILTGFMLGSLNKVWPWKETMTFYIKHAGTSSEEKIPLIEENISPFKYAEITGEPHSLFWAVFLMLLACILVFFLERQGKKSN